MSLKDKYQNLTKKYNWIKVNPETEVLEFYVDHTLLQALRNCEAYFELEFMLNRKPETRNWNLDFGSWFHECMELFYEHELHYLKSLRNESYNQELARHIDKGKFLGFGLNLWNEMKMNEHDKHAQFIKIKGEIGALMLLSDYHEVYGNGQERLQIIATEVPFGRDKEAPLKDYATFPIFCHNLFDAYLTGRLDLIVDNGHMICPLDHKTANFFNGTEATKYTPGEGMVGYVYAADKILRSLGGKPCSTIIVSHVCLTDKTSKENDEGKENKVLDPKKRFTRTHLSFTPEQLEEFRIRQIVTVDKLYDLLVLERPPIWNTAACSSMFHKGCPYKDFHSLTPAIRQEMIEKQLKVVEEWNPFYEKKPEGR